MGVEGGLDGRAEFPRSLVFRLMLDSSPQDAGRRVVERVGATAIGVGLALVFGVPLPRWQTARGEVHP